MVHIVDDLQQGRESYGRRAWMDAYESLSHADQAAPLGPEELELLARSAYMLGRDDDYVSDLERAHHAHLDVGGVSRAVRCAFWIGHNLLFRGESGPALGWFARAQRLLKREERDCVEQGYLLIPALLQHVFSGDFEAACATAAEAATIGERFGDQDLVAIALMEQGHALVKQGRRAEGLRLVDETMVAVTAGELSSIVAGIVYCNTIGFCQSVYELRRAREWTAALTRWCKQQPDMVAHRGLCLVHRAEIMMLGGAWQDALEEARRVGERFTAGVLNQRALGHAAYRQGEVHRLQGEVEAAEAAYQEASRFGREPQPGLALLRLAQGNGPAGAAAIRRALTEMTQPLKRAAAARLRRNHAHDRRRRGGAHFLPGARGDCGTAGERRAGCDVRASPRSGGAGRGRRQRRTGCAAPRLAGVAGARGAVRGRTHPGAGGPGLPRPGGRGYGHAGAGGGAASLRSWALGRPI